MGFRTPSSGQAGFAVGLILAAALTSQASARDLASVAKKPACVSESEMSAIGGRVLETELLVGALSCAQKDQYNAFMEKFRQPQTEGARTLQALFKRLYGRNGERELDAFVTRLGNDSALRSLEEQLGYCQATWNLFEEASSLPAADYGHLTTEPWIQERHKFHLCPASPASARGRG